MLRRITKLAIAVILGSILMSSCVPEEPQTSIIIERDSFQAHSAITELPIPNCGSDEALETEQRIDRKYTHEVETVLAPNSRTCPQELAQAVREYYQVEALVEVASYTLVANVPPDRIFTYQVEWTELWREGDIEIGKIDDSPEATYKFLESLVGGVVGIEMGTCVSESAIPPTAVPTPMPFANLPALGRLEITCPLEMTVGEADLVTVEIIADPELADVGIHPEYVTGVITVEVSSQGEVHRIEGKTRLYPIMAAELIATNFDISGDANARRVITTTLPAVWTWNISARNPGMQRITINILGETIINGESVLWWKGVSHGT